MMGGKVMSGEISRRTALRAGAAAAAYAALTKLDAQPQAVPIVDTHIHLFDQTLL